MSPAARRFGKDERRKFPRTHSRIGRGDGRQKPPHRSSRSGITVFTRMYILLRQVGAPHRVSFSHLFLYRWQCSRRLDRSTASAIMSPRDLVCLRVGRAVSHAPVRGAVSTHTCVPAVGDQLRRRALHYPHSDTGREYDTAAARAPCKPSPAVQPEYLSGMGR